MNEWIGQSLGDVVVFENRQLLTAAKFINKNSLLILLPGVIQLLELKPISELKAENIFAPLFRQIVYYRLYCRTT